MRSELIEALGARNPNLSRAEAELSVSTFFNALTEQLVAGGRVELRGFGSFSTRAREARIGRDPRTGRAVAVALKRVPYFRAGKEMKDRLDT